MRAHGRHATLREPVEQALGHSQRKNLRGKVSSD